MSRKPEPARPALALFLVAVSLAALVGWCAFELTNKVRALLGRKP
jgi:hypothetical protein